MSNTFVQIVEGFPHAALSIRKDGPPTYRGENPHRIIIDGNPDAFRMLGLILNMMADAVETNSKMKDGRYFVVDDEIVPQLSMDEGHMLAFSCEPETRATN